MPKLPPTFKFNGNKEIFPHFFNIIENQEYVVDIPSKDMSGDQSFNEKEGQKFLNWYDEEEQ